MGKSIRKLAAANTGSEIAEAALVLPLAFMILLGIYWFGRAFNVYATINHAAREGARFAVQSSCATCTPANQSPTSSPAGINSIGAAVGQAMQASGLDPSLATSPAVSYTACPSGPLTCQTPNGSGDPQISICSNVQLVASPPTASGGPSCGVAIDFQYPYKMGLPFTSLNGAPITLSAHIQMRTEQ
ncbi:MAG TPA: TadE/TadG family type IV pilus assembly protein [Terriglobales bacterium]